jgi:uncharacterized protein YndB with AHSA1/START domain
MAKSPNDNELRIVRVFDAPVELVWKAWTDEKHVGNWWGPRGFTLTSKSKDVRPGGKWIYTMHGPDGVDYPNIATYYEVEEFAKLVYDHGATETTPALFRVTVTFEQINKQTVMDMTMTVASAEAAKQMQQHIKDAGGNGTWDRLGEYLEEQQSQQDVFIINRSFNANQATLFELWTNPKHFSNWMGPTGSTMEILSADVRESGALFYSMTNADGSQMHGKVHYLKIQPHDLLIYTQNFCDPNGDLCKPPFAPTWPDSMRTTVKFSAEGTDETRITLKWEVNGPATDIERKTFKDAKPGMTVGWTGSFDKLDALVEASA